jgi:hypothetical protein
MKHAIRIGLMASVLGLLAAACSDEPAALPGGAMQLSWLVGTGGCEASGVDTVGVALVGGSSTTPTVYSYPCGQGSVTLSDLAPGTYDVSLYGNDPSGVARFGGQASNVQVRSEGTTTVATIRLSALPARIDVAWYFENGRLCSYNNVEDIEITLFRDEYEIFSTTSECGPGTLLLEDIQADTYVIDLLGRDSQGVARFNGQDEVIVERGDTAQVEIRLMEIAQQ